MRKTLISILASSVIGTAHAQNNHSFQYWKANDKTGISAFETNKIDSGIFDGIIVKVGGNFTQQFQDIDHSNTATAVLNADKININQLKKIGAGFNLATANLNLDAQLADGIRVNLTSYLSSRHHPETWVKGGYIQIDKMSFLKSVAIDNLMKYLSIRGGHMEINYGDAHFRRTDNGNAFHNPLVGNFIMDAFTTEVAGEIFFRLNGFLAMAAVSNGEIRGEVTNPDLRRPSWYGKLGYDKRLSENLRIRITSSLYTTESSVSNTLYGGDRAGSRYYFVMENTLASVSANFTSGRFNPGFTDKITAIVINPFIKFYGLELFANIEQAKGRNSVESLTRTWNQFGGEMVYRFGKNESFYFAGRYTKASGKLAGISDDVSIDRIQGGIGFFIYRNILTKVEYVQQKYDGFPVTNILSGGKFNGIMVEGSVAF